jgi:2-hydroxy-6-oxonona-2,4-dienedioate hydrolase
MTVVERCLTVAGVATRLLVGGDAQRPPVLFLHGGVPSASPFCGGAHLWGDVLERFARDRHVLALDLPGSGGSALPVGTAPLFERIASHVPSVIAALALGPCHLVGHDIGGLAALACALDAPALVASVTVVASSWAAPAGDGVDNPILAYPPQPPWSRASQAWALERLSYAHQHIDAALLGDCVAAAAGAPHRAAVAAMAECGFERGFVPSAGRARGRVFAACRAGGIATPVQLVWGKQDPLTTPDHGLTLFKAIASRQPEAQFDLINRAGSFVVREQKVAFHAVVAAFQDGLAGARSS